MTTTLTTKGQVTIPKQVRQALRLEAGSKVEFAVNAAGDVVLHKAGAAPLRQRKDRFDRLRGRAQVRWRTADLMALLRGRD